MPSEFARNIHEARTEAQKFFIVDPDGQSSTHANDYNRPTAPHI